MTLTEKLHVAYLMKTKKLNKRQEKWVKNQLINHRSTILTDSIFLLAAVIIWFVVIWVGVGL